MADACVAGVAWEGHSWALCWPLSCSCRGTRLGAGKRWRTIHTDGSICVHLRCWAAPVLRPAIMGKGGCQQSSLPGGSAPSDLIGVGSIFGINTLLNAIGSITSNRWAEDKIDSRNVVKRSYCGDERRTADGKIPWDTVEKHCTAESCWIVVKNKVRFPGCRRGRLEHEHWLGETLMLGRSHLCSTGASPAGVRRHRVCSRPSGG